MLPIVQRSYDLCAALYEHVNRLPRAQRGLIGRVMLDDGLRMLGLFAVANRRREKRETQAEASGHLDARAPVMAGPPVRRLGRSVHRSG